jgi:hypothetical protein
VIVEEVRIEVTEPLLGIVVIRVIGIGEGFELRIESGNAPRNLPAAPGFRRRGSAGKLGNV